MSSKLVYLTVCYPIDHFVNCTYVWTKWHLWKVIEIQDCLIRKLILFHYFEIETKNCEKIGSASWLSIFNYCKTCYWCHFKINLVAR